MTVNESWINNGVCSVVIFVANDDVLIVAQEKEIKSQVASIYLHKVTTNIKRVKILGKYFLL